VVGSVVDVGKVGCTVYVRSVGLLMTNLVVIDPPTLSIRYRRTWLERSLWGGMSMRWQMRRVMEVRTESLTPSFHPNSPPAVAIGPVPPNMACSSGRFGVE
jgi:hypothetical protein